MPRHSQHESWLPGLVKAFDASHLRVFSEFDLTRFLKHERALLPIPDRMTTTKIISLLVENGSLRQIAIRRESQKSATAGKNRYSWRDASPYQIGISLAKESYLSHATALFLHGLTDQLPKTIYVNREQSPKAPSRGGLTQAAIDRAFRNMPRTSKYVFVYESARFVLLSGKNSGRLEVSTVPGPNGEELETTKLERTLIDIVVRPAYAGGVYEVLHAYRTAITSVSVNSLMAVLKQLDYVYPYHQCIGFLMERAGYAEKHLAKCENLGIRWNFYLDYRIEDPAFDNRWRLYYPKGL